ncbi:hypothetical protein cand_016010 [Cryptosporidium andersoni]|uniref:Uncharacterized protein n=1 Tax=Cryptosporidium andersoni TaxID=117008 RepID=A0A1J4MTM3_9CRYT|nr:hypothetical protein cand_016010 [Cryptosporidium andersoni]
MELSDPKLNLLLSGIGIFGDFNVELSIVERNIVNIENLYTNYLSSNPSKKILSILDYYGYLERILITYFDKLIKFPDLEKPVCLSIANLVLYKSFHNENQKIYMWNLKDSEYKLKYKAIFFKSLSNVISIFFGTLEFEARYCGNLKNSTNYYSLSTYEKYVLVSLINIFFQYYEIEYVKEFILKCCNPYLWTYIPRYLYDNSRFYLDKQVDLEKFKPQFIPVIPIIISSFLEQMDQSRDITNNEKVDNSLGSLSFLGLNFSQFENDQDVDYRYNNQIDLINFGRVETLETWRYLQSCLHLLLSLISQKFTRIILLPFLCSIFFISRCKLSRWFFSRQGRLYFRPFVEMLNFYIQYFPYNSDEQYKRISDFQICLFKKWNSSEEYMFQNIPEDLLTSPPRIIGNPEEFNKLIKQVPTDIIRSIAIELGIFPIGVDKFEELYFWKPNVNIHGMQESDKLDRIYFIQILSDYLTLNNSFAYHISNIAILPSENLIWDPLLSASISSLEINHTLLDDINFAFPQLNLEYLDIDDFLFRNFLLLRLDSYHQIREDLEDVIARLDPQMDSENRDLSLEQTTSTIFRGYSRFAIPIHSFSILYISSPRLGLSTLDEVCVEFVLNLKDISPEIALEWDSLKKKDVLFLVSMVMPSIHKTESNIDNYSFVDLYGVNLVRGCIIVDILDEAGVSINSSKNEEPKGTWRVIRALLDSVVVNEDKKLLRQSQDIKEYRDKLDLLDLYSNFNIVIRRDPKKNNFYTTLNNIKNFLIGDPSNSESLISDIWFQSLILGNLPKENTYKKLENNIELLSGPENIIFTEEQTRAIYSSLNKGITIICGPPGTGKTDIASNVLSQLCNSNSNERIVVIAHSNHALNNLFEKILMYSTIPTDRLLRLGYSNLDGIEKNKTIDLSRDFSLDGRIKYILDMKESLLLSAKYILMSIKCVPIDETHITCSSFNILYKHFIVPVVEELEISLKEYSQKSQEPTEDYCRQFPFSQYWLDYVGCKLKDSLDYLECLKAIKSVFTQLEEIEFMEILTTNHDRGQYILSKYSKVIAMTCRYAILHLEYLRELNLGITTFIIEEAAQITDAESILPLLINQTHNTISKNINYKTLNRLIFIGDNKQLAPTVTHPLLKRYSNLDQSLFERLLRLDHPCIFLSKQGRCRSTILHLFSHNYYPILTSMPHIQDIKFQKCISGLYYEYQFVDIEQGIESQPMPYFYQNLLEAEFVVALYMYLRSVGYPSPSIAILTPYIGQVNLINDIINQRCSWNPHFGKPLKVTSIDHFQGRQSEIIILSLVRTKHIGYLKDLKRWNVALSRATLGLYIVGNWKLFSRCLELKILIEILEKRSKHLIVLPNEPFQSNRSIYDVIEVKDTLNITNHKDLWSLVQTKINRSEVN